MEEFEREILQGLSSQEAEKRLAEFGENELIPPRKATLFFKLLNVLREPMFLLLLVTATIYFCLGALQDGVIMLVFVVGIICIDMLQKWKTDKTLMRLKKMATPVVCVKRDGREQWISSAKLVPGDLLLLSEGDKIAADGRVIRANDLAVDESSLTGESQTVWKTVHPEESPPFSPWRTDYCYAGTLVCQGSGWICVENTGLATEFGKIGAHIARAPERPSPLQKQTNVLVHLCAWIAFILFAAVGIATWFNLPLLPITQRLVDSVLSGVTLAMAMIPEEFPVVLTVFLSLGAWRLAKRNALVRRLPCVETLGAVSVLCVDKTGTITQNEMCLQQSWRSGCRRQEFMEIMALACEIDPYDPMEKAMQSYCIKNGVSVEELQQGQLVKEYPFTHKAKMMGHIWERNGKTLIAVKGAPEQVFALCDMDQDTKVCAYEALRKMSAQGLRVIAIAGAYQTEPWRPPEDLGECSVQLYGLAGLADPPRRGIAKEIEKCKQAGIRVVMITGDSGETARAIAKRVGMDLIGSPVTGEQLDQMAEEELSIAVRQANLFARVVPEHKSQIVNALQKNGEIVAMTGDGVNDAPALKFADIGIAMGKRGSEVAREAADIILMDDNFSTIIRTVQDGRRIYDNIRKAIGYIFTIHIPIAFSALLGPLLHIGSSDLFLLPLHVVLLELLIDPTCSIVLERQPAERDIMQRPPRQAKEAIVTRSSFLKSLLQGFMLFIGSFSLYYFMLLTSGNAQLARTMGLSVIVFSNLMLTCVNSSYLDRAATSLLRLAKDKLMWGIALLTIGGLLLLIYSPLHAFFKLSPLTGEQLFLSAGVAVLSVCWYEIVKFVKRRKARKNRVK